MNKANYILITILLFTFNLNSKGEMQKDNIYKIIGQIDKQYDGKYISLNKIRNDSVIATEQCQIKQGTFTFEGKVDTPEMAQIIFESIIINGKPLSKDVIVEKGEIRVIITDTLSRIEGTPLNDLYQSYQDSSQYYVERLKHRIKREETPAGIGVQFSTISGSPEEVLFNRFRNFLTPLVKQNLSNIAGKAIFLNILQSVFGPNPATVIERNVLFKGNKFMEFYDLLDEKLKQHERVIEAVEMLNAKEKYSNPLIGKIFTDFELQNPQGKKVQLADFVGKSELLVIEFTASWCSACHSSIPYLKEVYEKYHPLGVDFISISIDTNVKAWRKMVDKVNVSWPQLSDLKGNQSGCANYYNINGVPAILVLDKSGRIIEGRSGCVGLSWTLDAELAKK